MLKVKQQLTFWPKFLEACNLEETKPATVRSSEMTSSPEETGPAYLSTATRNDTELEVKTDTEYGETEFEEKNDAAEDAFWYGDCFEDQEEPDDPFPHSSMDTHINLNRHELLKLLSVFEGELQARDEVIALLKSECAQNSNTRYGLNNQPVEALQRDAATLNAYSQDYTNEQSRDELKEVIKMQKETCRRLSEMQELTEEKYQLQVTGMEEEKKKHQEYMTKSDDFINLLDNDRERLKQLLEQEKSVHDRKEKELQRKVQEDKEEASRLKVLSLELKKERQQQLQVLNDQRLLVTTLQQQLEEKNNKVKEAETEAAAEKEHATQLENELEEQTNRFDKEHEVLTASLAREKANNKKLEEKVKSMGEQMSQLESVDKSLRKTDDQLWKIQEKLENDLRYENLLEEVELLRKTLAGMQETEKIYAQAQEDCAELREAYEKEVKLTQSLRTEVDTLRKSARNRTEMERCIEEAMFRFDEIMQMFNAESKKVLELKKQIKEYQEKLQKVDESQSLLKESEEKLTEVRALVLKAQEDKEKIQTQLQLEINTSSKYKGMLEEETTKVTEAKQQMIEESKRVLKLQEQLANLEMKRQDEMVSLNNKLERAEVLVTNTVNKEKAIQMEALIHGLRKQIIILRKRLDQSENESGMKENEAWVIEDEAEMFALSTGRLNRLGSLGLTEQGLEVINARIRQKINILESQLHHNNEQLLNRNRNKDSRLSSQSSLKKEINSVTSPSGRILPRRRTASAIVTTTNISKPPSVRHISASTAGESLMDRNKSVRNTASGALPKRTISKQNKTTVPVFRRANTATTNPNGTLISANVKTHTLNGLPRESETIHESLVTVGDIEKGSSLPQEVVTEKNKKDLRGVTNRTDTSTTTRPQPAPNTTDQGKLTTNHTTSVVTPSDSKRTLNRSNSFKKEADSASANSPTRIPKFQSSPTTPSTLPRPKSKSKVAG